MHEYSGPAEFEAALRAAVDEKIKPLVADLGPPVDDGSEHGGHLAPVAERAAFFVDPDGANLATFRGHVAENKLTLVDGPPGAGKATLIANLIAAEHRDDPSGLTFSTRSACRTGRPGSTRCSGISSRR